MRLRVGGFFLVLFAGLVFNPLYVRAGASFDYSPYARVLRNYVTENGFVHYARLQADRADLDAFVAQLERTSPENSAEAFPAQADRLAYWINAYNALVMKAILDHYPVRSLTEISFLYGFFWRLKFPVGGREYTLDQIEHGIIRPQFREPRIHFAINCASASCPRLIREPYLPEKLDEQLEEAARFFISETRNVRPEPDRNRLYLSMIFNWYLNDFRDSVRESLHKKYPSVLDYIPLYASPELKNYIETKKPAIRYVSYDWSLNDAGQ